MPCDMVVVVNGQIAVEFDLSSRSKTVTELLADLLPEAVVNWREYRNVFTIRLGYATLYLSPNGEIEVQSRKRLSDETVNEAIESVQAAVQQIGNMYRDAQMVEALNSIQGVDVSYNLDNAQQSVFVIEVA